MVVVRERVSDGSSRWWGCKKCNREDGKIGGTGEDRQVTVGITLSYNCGSKRNHISI